MPRTFEKQISTKELLVDAATAVFSEYGLKGATTKEIAKRAGVHETTLFRHFDTKEQLLRAVLEKMSQEMMLALQQKHEWADDLYKDLLATGYIFRDALVKNNALLRMLISEGHTFQKEFQQILQTSHLSFKEHVISYIEQAKFTGQIRPELDAQKIGRLYTGIIMASVLRGDMAENSVLQEQMPPVPGITGVISLDDCLDMLLNGITVRP